MENKIKEEVSERVELQKKIDLIDWPEPPGIARSKEDELTIATLKSQVKDLKAARRELEKKLETPVLRPLPDECRSLTHRVIIDGVKIYLTTHEYEDGKLGKIEISLDKHGGVLRVYASMFRTASLLLQYGVPLSVLIADWELQNLVPCGITNNPQIPFAKSIEDYTAKWLKTKYPNGYRAISNERRSA